MQPFEIELKDALDRPDAIPAAEAVALNERIVQAYGRKQRAAHGLLLAYLAFFAVSIIGMMGLLISTSDLKECLFYGIGILIAIEGSVLLKIWYWIVHSKIATVREIKMLHVAIAELKGRVSPAQQGSGHSSPASDVPALEPAAPGSRSWWLAILGPVWMLSVASLVYLISLSYPHNLTAYFKKTIGAAEVVAGKEWQETFEVTQPRQHFQVRLIPAGMTTRNWVQMSVAAEGREPMLTGTLNELRIYPGRATSGRYTVKAKAEKAGLGYTVLISGLDEVPSLSPIHLLWLFISAALTCGIPLGWVQRLWLRRIDPDLLQE
jgi:hypothetical protein